MARVSRFPWGPCDECRRGSKVGGGSGGRSEDGGSNGGCIIKSWSERRAVWEMETLGGCCT